MESENSKVKVKNYQQTGMVANILYYRVLVTTIKFNKLKLKLGVVSVVIEKRNNMFTNQLNKMIQKKLYRFI